MQTLQPNIQNILKNSEFQVDVLRLDLIDAEISGNKWFKLKYNLVEAQKQKLSTILTFGGAHSNHLAATAAACHKFRIKSIGVIRGDRSTELNPTLKKASEQGMQLHFVSRADYALKEIELLVDLKKRFGHFYVVPEGGNNKAGILGCKEILSNEMDHDYVLCACGTGATIAGILGSIRSNQVVIGISVLKGENTLPFEVKKQLLEVNENARIVLKGNEALEVDTITDACISNAYAFSGYAKLNQELINFKSDFENKYNIPLDYIYTSKLMYAAFDLIKKNKFPKNSKVLLIHSGGLQGNSGFEARYHLMPNR